MAYKEHLTWKQNTKRWQKRVPVGMPDAGKMIQVGQRKLKQLYPSLFVCASRSGSRDAANQYWTDQVEQHTINNVLYESAIKQRQTILDAEKIRSQKFEDKYRDPKEYPNAEFIYVKDRNEMYQSEIEQLNKQIELLEESKEQGSPYETTDIELPELPTIEQPKEISKQNISYLIAEKIMRLEKRTKLNDTNKRALSKTGFGNQKRFLKSILAGLGDIHISKLNEDKIKEYFDFIDERDISEKTKIDYWIYFKEFVKGCHADKLLILPTNIDKKELTFSADPKTPDPCTIEESKYVLEKCQEHERPLLELAVLLHLNCAMYNKDIGLLQKSNVDLKAGTLTYKRTKAKKHEQITKVTYPLWKRTTELLKELESNDKKYWLMTSEGTPYSVGKNGGKKDGIGQAFGRFQKHLPEFEKTLMDFRKTGCNELEELGHPDKLTKQFLQQGADDTKGRYYSGRMRTPFTKAVMELEGVFL